jgi:hypothetical protein
MSALGSILIFFQKIGPCPKCDGYDTKLHDSGEKKKWFCRRTHSKEPSKVGRHVVKRHDMPKVAIQVLLSVIAAI